MQLNRLWTALDRLSIVGVIAVSLTFGWVTLRTKAPKDAKLRPPSQALEVTGLSQRGESSAPLGMVIYSDFECPFCGVFAKKTWPEIDKALVQTGRLRVVFRQFPIEQIHKTAKSAAISALCAAEQSSFWEMHDFLFQNQARLGAAGPEAVSVLKLDKGRFEHCLGGSAASIRVDAELSEAKALGVSSTPSFFIGKFEQGNRLRVTDALVGASPMSDFTAAFERAEQSATPVPSPIVLGVALCAALGAAVALVIWRSRTRPRTA